MTLANSGVLWIITVFREFAMPPLTARFFCLLFNNSIDSRLAMTADSGRPERDRAAVFGLGGLPFTFAVVSVLEPCLP